MLTLTGVQATKQGNWQIQIYALLDSCGRVVAGAEKRQRTTGRFADRLEAAVARDLCVIWLQLRLGCDPAAAGEAFNCPLNSLLQQEALLGQLRECPSLRDLRQLLEGLAATGHLRCLAATLLTQRTAAAFVGVQQIRNSWMAHVTVGLDEQLRPSGAAERKGYSVGSFGSEEEGAAARDVAIIWRQLVLGASPYKAHEKLNLPLDGLLQQEALLAQLKLCPSLRDLRQLLEGLAVAGELRRLATTLLTQRTTAVAAATGQHAAATAAAAAAAAPAAMDSPLAVSMTPTAAPPPAAAAASAVADGIDAPSLSAGLTAALPKRLFVGITRQEKGWQAGMWVSLDEQQRLSSAARKTSKSLGCFGSMEEAAMARDIGVIWKQLGVGASPHAASEKLNAPMDSLLQQEALLGQLRECSSLRDLRQLLEGLAATGHLRRLAATLLTQRTAAVAAAIGEQQAAPAASQPVGPASATAPGVQHAAAALPAASPDSAAAADGQAGRSEEQPSGAAAELPLVQPSAAVEPAARDAPGSVVVRSERSPEAAADALAGSAIAQQTAAVPARRRKGRMAGVTLRGCKWQATVYIGLTPEGRPSDAIDRISRAAGSFEAILEAGIARDLAISWRQLALGAPIEAATEAFNARLPMLQRESALLAQLQRCATWRELRTQLQQYAEQGKLAELAGRLLPPALSAAAAVAAGRHPAADLPGGRRLRARAPIKLEEGADEEGSEEDGQRPAKRNKSDGHAAVGRCIEVWLGEGSSRQPFTGLVVERIPSGKHHVLFSDGEEALLDFEEEDVRFIECPSEAAAVAEAARAASKPADAAAAAASKRDKGQRLSVLWPDGQWWSGKITYAVGTGLHCVRYDDDNSELLVDVMEEQVKWHSAERQQEHERQLRQYRRQDAAPGEEGSGDLFDYMMACAEAPGAEAAGLTGELVCQYQELLDTLQPPARAAKEERLRKQLAAGKFGNAAAMMRMAVNLALGTPPGAA
ncbi:hypothetical protein C2E21_1603 [Chlorella sorokiniana]|uniref:Uncharacterized protein n=1 Tax=Chlorella sorokiniana TaxID=3076 RepID=A0A2P6U0I5_CHLSO|nr:hypothetical protein C2E21_1603 [Chlorella sorokiniana]|eukprot:PRW59832.1 hypothetical protein C2E21_1603 [Chlorella sorokiniana]